MHPATGGAPTFYDVSFNYIFHHEEDFAVGGVVPTWLLGRGKSQSKNLTIQTNVKTKKSYCD